MTSDLIRTKEEHSTKDLPSLPHVDYSFDCLFPYAVHRLCMSICLILLTPAVQGLGYTASQSIRSGTAYSENLSGPLSSRLVGRRGPHTRTPRSKIREQPNVLGVPVRSQVLSLCASDEMGHSSRRLIPAQRHLLLAWRATGEGQPRGCTPTRTRCLNCMVTTSQKGRVAAAHDIQSRDTVTAKS